MTLLLNSEPWMGLSENRSGNLARLRAMTRRLTDLATAGTPTHVEYEAGENGTIIGLPLWNQPDVAVQRAFLSAGSVLPAHSHVEHEHLICVSGRIQLDTGGEVRELTQGDGIYLPPGQEHAATVAEDCWLIGIIVPGGEEYPGVG